MPQNLFYKQWYSKPQGKLNAKQNTMFQDEQVNKLFGLLKEKIRIIRNEIKSEKIFAEV